MMRRNARRRGIRRPCRLDERRLDPAHAVDRVQQIGKRQKNAMKGTFWRLPIECSRTIEIGNSAGGGIARQYSTCGIANRRDQRERPSGMPTTTPRTAPIPKPSRIRSMLGTTCVSNCEKSHRSWNSGGSSTAAGSIGCPRYRPQLPGDEDQHGDRDLGADLERRVGALAHRPPPAEKDASEGPVARAP